MTLDPETGWDLLFWGLYALLLAGCSRQAWRARRGRAGRGRAGRRGRLPLVAAALLALFGLVELLLRAGGSPTARGLVLLGVPFDPYVGWLGRQLDGDPQSSRPRALVIGDSFTAGFANSQGVPYYQSLSSELGMEVWMRSGPGWGTLQELLILERDVGTVRPDLIVLQICANDFINNSWELERTSVYNNNLSRRPYWEQGMVVWRTPGLWQDGARALAARSACLAQAAVRFHRLRLRLAAGGLLPSVEARIAETATRFAPFGRAVATTEELLARFAARARPARLVVVPADALEPYAAEWRALLERQRVRVLRSGLVRLRAARQAGETVEGPDGNHWNEHGHAIVGQALADFVRALERRGRRSPPRRPGTARWRGEKKGSGLSRSPSTSE